MFNHLSHYVILSYLPRFTTQLKILREHSQMEVSFGSGMGQVLGQY